MKCLQLSLKLCDGLFPLFQRRFQLSVLSLQLIMKKHQMSDTCLKYTKLLSFFVCHYSLPKFTQKYAFGRKCQNIFVKYLPERMIF